MEIIKKIIEQINLLHRNQLKIAKQLNMAISEKEKCYNCGKEFGECEHKIITRISESPKDEYGQNVPFCEWCYDRQIKKNWGGGMDF